MDGYVGTFETEYHYLFWRPVTGIQLAATDANPATTADPTWTPLLPTPPIPTTTRDTRSRGESPLRS